MNKDKLNVKTRADRLKLYQEMLEDFSSDELFDNYADSGFCYWLYRKYSYIELSELSELAIQMPQRLKNVCDDFWFESPMENLSISDQSARINVLTKAIELC